MIWAHVVAIGLLLLHLVLRACRVWLLMPHGRRPSIWLLVVTNAYGDLAAAITPARLGGEPARVLALGRAGVPGGTSVVAIGAERVLEWAAIVSITLALLSFMGGSIMQGARTIWARMSTPSALPWAGVIALLVIVGVLTLRVYRKRHPAALRQTGVQALNAVRALSPTVLVLAILVTAGVIATRITILPVLLLAFVTDVDWFAVTIGSFALIYGQLFIPTPSGVGPVEFGFIAGFSQILPAPELTLLLITWRFYTVAMSAIVGAVFFVRSFLTKRRLASVALVLLGTGLAPTNAFAQDVASRYLPLGHWAYEYVQRLRTRGFLSNLSPLSQPYTRAAIATGLAALEPDSSRGPERRWVALLEDEFAFELQRIRGGDHRTWGVRMAGGVRASTSKRLDPMRPVGDDDVWPRYYGSAWVEIGPVAAETRVHGDAFYNDDPEGIDPQTRQGGRTDQAYLTITIPHVRFNVGKFARNWSALGSGGLMVSDVPYPYPQIGIDVQAGRFALRSFTGELDTFDDQKRYVAAQKLEYRVGDLAVSFGASILYAGTTGFSLRFLNPVEFLFFERNEQPNDVFQNLMLTAQFWYQGGGNAFYAEAMLDDFDIDPGNRDREPTLYGFTVGSRLSSMAPWLELGIEYQQVSAWAYRTPNVADEYSFLRRGLGENFSDFDRISLEATIFPSVRNLQITPMIQYQRQGEGNFRDSVPSREEYLGSESLFLGVKESTLRVGFRGRFQPNQYIWFSWNIGHNFVTNDNHLQGTDDNEFSAVAAAGVSINLPTRRRR